MIIDKEFMPCLEHLELQVLGTSDDVIYFVDHNLYLMGYNEAWKKFALENNGEDILERFSINCNIIDAISGDAKEFYLKKYQQAHDAKEPYTHEYECSSDAIYRKFQQTAYPLPQQRGFYITNHLSVSKPIPYEVNPFSDCYINSQGFIVQCSHCRRVQNHHKKESWDWIPELVRHPRENTSHTYCPPCFDFYYRG